MMIQIIGNTVQKVEKMSLMEYAAALADALDKVDRHGGEKDSPEGVRYITISDTLARQIADTLRAKAWGEPET